MIHIIVGTKAQLIKMAPIMKVLDDEGVGYRYLLTGQHEKTMDDIAANFSLREPDRVLYEGPEIVGVGQMVSWFTRFALLSSKACREIFVNDDQGIVLVHGDTLSALVGAILARRAGIAVGHVESGLSSGRLWHPFPEELTRRLVIRMGDHLFCPGSQPARYARQKNPRARVVDIGANTLLDALHMVLKSPPDLRARFPDLPECFAVASLHRFENTATRAAVTRLLALLSLVAERLPVVFVLHEVTRNALEKYGQLQTLVEHPRIHLVERMDYATFIGLLGTAQFLVSDGGSNQEECYYLGKPILLLRAATERSEGLQENCLLSHYEPELVTRFLDGVDSFTKPPRAVTVSPSSRVVESLWAYAS